MLNACRRDTSSVSETEPLTAAVELDDSPDEQVADVQVVAEPLPDELPVKLVLGGVVLDEARLFDSPMLPYLRMLVRLVEGIRLSCRELGDLLRSALRQRSIASRSRADYVLRFLNQHPP